VKPGAIAQKRILIVEDDYLVAQELATSFKKAGARIVGPVSSVTSALEALRGGLPHAAVLDVVLDGETAYPIAEFLSEHGIPFVFATAFNSVVPPPYRGVKIFEKPVALPELTQSVAELASAHRTARRTAYGVRNVGRRWEWCVYVDGHPVAQGTESTSVRARVAALVNATRLKMQ
jgi:DNA-binding response OmpR family regulator